MVFVLPLLLEQLVVRHGPINGSADMADIERLSDVVVSAHAHCFDSGFDCLLSADHYHYRVGSHLMRCAAPDSRPLIPDMLISLITRSKLKLARTASAFSAESTSHTRPFGQHVRQQIPDLFIVVDDQDTSSFRQLHESSLSLRLRTSLGFQRHNVKLILQRPTAFFERVSVRISDQPVADREPRAPSSRESMA